MLISEASRNVVKLADSFALNPGSIVARDRGYTNFALFGRWTTVEVYFVTRLKEKTLYEVVVECQISANRGILAEQIIRLTGPGAEDKRPCQLRRTENNREIKVHSI